MSSFTFGIILNYAMMIATMAQLDRFMFDYSQLNIGPVCTTVGWIHDSQSCRPATFVVEGFELADITDNQFDAPRLSFNSTSPIVTFPTSQIMEETFYFKIYATDQNGARCNLHYSSANAYYQIEITDAYIPLCQAPGTVVCTPIPATINNFVWPRNLQFDDYCLCTPTENAFYPFSNCVLDCGSDYSLMIRNNSVCFSNITSQMNNTPVYFVSRGDHCGSSGDSCFITSIESAYKIIIQYNCEFLQNTSSSINILLPYDSPNYTIIYNESQPSMLYINVTYTPDSEPPDQLLWTHNGVVIRRNPRATLLRNGSLIINNIKLSDNGSYTLIASNALGCESITFNVFTEFLNITESWLTTMGEEIVFRCTAEGFPNPQLLAWKAATLERVSGNMTMTVTNKNDIKISTDTLIVMNNSICTEARAYFCVYSSGITLMESAMLDCPPGPPVVEVNYINSTLCVDAYSHSDHPVEYYSINITSSSCDAVYIIYNTSQCFHLPSDLYPDECGPFVVSISATNDLGTSDIITAYLTGNFNKTNDSTIAISMIITPVGLISGIAVGGGSFTMLVSITILIIVIRKIRRLKEEHITTETSTAAINSNINIIYEEINPQTTFSYTQCPVYGVLESGTTEIMTPEYEEINLQHMSKSDDTNYQFTQCSAYGAPKKNT